MDSNQVPVFGPVEFVQWHKISDTTTNRERTVAWAQFLFEHAPGWVVDAIVQRGGHDLRRELEEMLAADDHRDIFKATV